MSSPARVVANSLNNIAGTWFVGVAREPAEPQNCITVYDTGGQAPDTDQLDIIRANIMVRVRSQDYEDGQAMAVNIRSWLPTQTPAGSFGVVPTSEVSHAGFADNDAYLFTVNFTVFRN